MFVCYRFENINKDLTTLNKYSINITRTLAKTENVSC